MESTQANNEGTLKADIFSLLKSEIRELISQPNLDMEVSEKVEQAMNAASKKAKAEVIAVIPKYMWASLLILFTPAELVELAMVIHASLTFRAIVSKNKEGIKDVADAGYSVQARVLSTPVKKAFDTAIQNSDDNPDLLVELHNDIPRETGISPEILEAFYKQIPYIKLQIGQVIDDQETKNKLTA